MPAVAYAGIVGKVCTVPSGWHIESLEGYTDVVEGVEGGCET